MDKRLLRFYVWVGLGYFLLGIFTTLSNYPTRFFPVIFNNFWGLLYVSVINYFLFEYSIPFLLQKRKFILYNIFLGIVLLWVHLLLYSYGSYAWRLFGVQLHIYTPLKTFASIRLLVANQMGYSAGSIFFFGISRHIYGYTKLKQAEQQLRIEKQEAELNYLKSQTNPHFLFNTLNNIYSLAKDKSDLAPEAVMRLSKMLRFMLYETNGEFIAIEQELKIINDYIALEQLRYDENLRIQLHHDIEDMKQAIPPLLLMPLVENAFKHGVSETRGHAFIDIHLSVNKRFMTFIVKNSSGTASDEGEKLRENIGLSNLRRQLALLYKDYDLSIQQTGAVFTAILKINLASHV